MSVSGVRTEQAVAAAMFLNSTAGRLPLFRNSGKQLAFPTMLRIEHT